MALLSEQKGSIVGEVMEIILHVSDMNKQVAFYRDKLGLSVSWPREVPDYTKEGWVTLDTGHCVLALHDGGRIRHGEPPSHRIVFAVGNIQQARSELEKRGVAIGELRSPAPGVSVFEARDPEGNILSFEAHSDK